MAHTRTPSVARLLLLLTLLAPLLSIAAELEIVDLRGRTLVEVLALYRAEGYEIVHSTDLVTEAQRVEDEPPPGTPLERLTAALAPFGLAVERVSSRNWLIIRAEYREIGVSGTVVDRFNLPVAYSTITVRDVEIVTDELGRFRLPLATGRYRVTASAPGYLASTLTVGVGRRGMTPAKFMLTGAGSIENVVVTASRYELADEAVSSQYLLTRDQLENTPTLGDDAIRIINALPGSASIGFSSRPQVRGGDGDETLMLFDDVELIEPFHLKDYQNLFSTFNPGTIRSVDFYTGGFPARYGNRMSAVLDIATQQVPDTFGGEFALSTFATSLTAHGRGTRNDWLVSARRGNLDLLTDAINPDAGDPAYYDGLLRFGRDLDSSARIEFSVLNYTDRVELNFNDSHARSEITNTYEWLRWDHASESAVNASTLITRARVHHRRNGIAEDEDKLIGEVADRRSIGLVGVQHIVEWRIDERRLLEAGLYANRHEARFRYEASAERGLVAPVIGNELEVEHDLTAAPDGWSAGGYVSLTADVSDRLTIQPGLRFDVQDYLGPGSREQLSPRFSALYRLDASNEIRASIGRFHQPQGIHELQIGDGVTRFFKPQRADHAILAFQHLFANDVILKSELFYKRVKVTKPRFVNLFNSFLLLPEIAQDRVRIDADRAYASGFELQASSPGDKPLVWWANYAYAEVKDRVTGSWVRRKWDQPHTLNGGLNWRRGNWNLGLIASWHTGWATTGLPLDTEPDDRVDVQALRNNRRYRNFATLNTRIARTFLYTNAELTAFLEVTNLVNRTNDGGFDYALIEEEDEDTGEVVVEVERDVEPVLPLATSIGIVLRF